LADGEFHWYRISPSLNRDWSGAIGVLRLDFGGSAPTVHYKLRRVVLAY
jgi:hypothetical protein